MLLTTPYQTIFTLTWYLTQTSRMQVSVWAVYVVYTITKKYVTYMQYSINNSYNLQISVKFTKEVFLAPTLTTCGGFITNFFFCPPTIVGFFSRMMLKTLSRSCTIRMSSITRSATWLLFVVHRANIHSLPTQSHTVLSNSHTLLSHSHI